MIDIVTPAQIILTCIALGVVGVFAIAHAMRRRPAPRNVRRVPLESGNTVPRMPNVRRAVHVLDSGRPIPPPPPRCPIAATPTVVTWPVNAPEWDEPTVTGPRGEP